MEVTIRSYGEEDFPALLRIQRECFPPPFPPELHWTPAHIRSHALRFPEGALAASCDGELVGSATAHILAWDQVSAHTWAEASADGFLTNHDVGGDTLYGVDVAVRPAWRRLGVARALYAARYALVRRLGLARFVAGSRLAGYAGQRARQPGLQPEDYAAAVASGELVDPVITPQLRAGLRPLRVVRGYLPDAEAADCALLMAWTNPDRRPPEPPCA